MSGSRGWKIAVAALAVGLAAALAAVAALAASRGGGEDPAGEGKVAELEEEVASLKEQEPKPASLSVESKKGGSDGSRTSSGSSGGYAPADDEAQLKALALAIANGHCPDNKWQVGETVIDGAWARVSIWCPSDPHVQGECLYFHKVGGSWQYVTCGTGLCYGDIPGAPATIYP